MSEALDPQDERIAQLQEELCLSRQDEERWRTENIALRNFIQNLYESCEGLEDTELTLPEVLENLKRNIQVFARDHRIRL